MIALGHVFTFMFEIVLQGLLEVGGLFLGMKRQYQISIKKYTIKYKCGTQYSIYFGTQ